MHLAAAAAEPICSIASSLHVIFQPEVHGCRSSLCTCCGAWTVLPITPAPSCNFLSATTGAQVLHASRGESSLNVQESHREACCRAMRSAEFAVLKTRSAAGARWRPLELEAGATPEQVLVSETISFPAGRHAEMMLHRLAGWYSCSVMLRRHEQLHTEA